MVFSWVIVLPASADIDIAKYARAHSGAIARIRDTTFDAAETWDGPWADGKLTCTGFHIGSGIVVTAGHCSTTNLKTITFEWGYLKRGQTSLISIPVEIISRSAIGYHDDHAIFRVSPIPKDQLPFEPDRVPEKGEPIFTIGHPYGRPQTVSTVGDSTETVICNVGRIMSFEDIGILSGNSGGPLISRRDGVVLGTVNTVSLGTSLGCLNIPSRTAHKRP